MTLTAVATISSSLPLASHNGATPGGPVVEELGPTTGGVAFDLRVGDVLTHWRRSTAGGQLESPFDFERVLLDELPRGSVEVSVLRAGQPRHVVIAVGGPGITLRPGFAVKQLELYSAGRQQIAEGALENGVALWQQLSEQLAVTGQHHRAAWLWRRIGRTWADENGGEGEGALQAFENAIELSRTATQPNPASDDLMVEEELAKLLTRRGATQEAERRHQEILARQGGPAADRLDAARSLIYLASLARSRSDLETAQQRYQRALDIRRKLAPASLPVAEGLNGLAIVAVDRGEFDDGANLHRQALEIRLRLAPVSHDAFISYNNLGVLAFKQGDYPGADEHFLQALEIQKRLAPESLGVATATGNLAVVATRQGDLARAEELFRQALSLRERLAPGGADVATALGNLGVVHAERGDLAAAETLQRRALEIKQRLDPEGSTVALSLLNLGSIMTLRGDLEGAEEHFRHSMAIETRLVPGGLRLATAFLALADLSVRRGESDKAERWLRKVIAITGDKAPQSYDHTVALHNLGEVVLDRGDLAGAEEILERALRIKEERAPAGSISTLATLLRLADVAHRRGALDLAAKRFERALAQAQDLAPGSLDEAEASAGLAEVYIATGRRQEALALKQRSIHALENQSRRLGGSADLRTRFAARHGELYRRYLDQLLEEGQPELAFDVLERYRARVFLTLLAERDLLFAADLPEDLQRRRRRLNAEYDRLFETLANRTSEPSQRTELRRELASVRRRQDETTAAVRKANPHLASLTDPETLDLAAVRQQLDPGTLLLSYSVGIEHSVLFAVGPEPDDFAVARLNVSAETLERHVDRLRSSIKALADKEVLEASLSKLGNLLLGPVASSIESSERLLVLPDGPLHQLPFGALLVPAPEIPRLGEKSEPEESRGGRVPLVALRPVTVAASATVFAELANQRGSREERNLVAVGDPDYSRAPLVSGSAPRIAPQPRQLAPLPSTRAEVEHLGELFASNAQLYLGAEANEERVKEMASQASILHLAGHGLIDPLHPLDSALALARRATPEEGGENGFLQAWEIFEQLRIDAELVTLSACRAGLGPTRGGEGLMGLIRAFQFAGASSVLAPLWSVSDHRTALLMGRFYDYFVAGSSKDEALRRAQVDLLEGPLVVDGATVDATHPLYWAGFQLFGDWR